MADVPPRVASLQEVRAILARHRQLRLLRHYGGLRGWEQRRFRAQLAAINFRQVAKWAERFVSRYKKPPWPGDIQPPLVEPALPRGARVRTHAEARQRGRELLKQGKVAAFVVAGGQGTRLGFPGPKGCYPVTPVTAQPLFRVFAEQILAVSRRAGVAIRWYVMTSPANDAETRAFFAERGYFGLPRGDVFFLTQGVLPVLDRKTGKLLLDGKGRVAMSPDGHGGSLLALRDSGALADMARRGIELISYFQADNPLVRCLDPLFLGLHDLHGAEMSAKCVRARFDLTAREMEKVGVLCRVDGRTCVIEYSDIPTRGGKARLDLIQPALVDGGWLAGSTAVHVLSRSFVDRLTEGGTCGLPRHRAVKKVPCVDASGRLVEPTTKNAVKLERFVFDALPLASRAVVLEALRSEEFSPVKNAEGSDSAATCRRDQVRRAAAWLEAAGVRVPRGGDGEPAATIEISPRFADSAEELARRLRRKPSISPGEVLYHGAGGRWQRF